MSYSQPSSFSTGQQPVPPTVPRGGLALGDIFTGTFRTYRSRLGLFVLLTLVPVLLVIVVGVVFIAGMMGWAFNAFASRDFTHINWGAFAMIVVFYLVGLLVASVLQYVYFGRGMVAAIDLAEGRAFPTWRNLRERTPGLFGRVIVLALLVFGIVLGVYLVLIIVMAAATGGFRSDPGAALALFFLLMLAVMVGAFWISVKMVYTLVTMAEEGASAVEALRRSFAMVRGAFWKTFGYALTGGLVVYVGSMALSLLGTPLTGLLDSRGPLEPATLVYLVLYGVVLFVGLALLSPVQMIWTGLMYLARRRELAGETVSGPQFGPFAPQPSPNPGAPYPPPGAPFPNPGAPYPPPGTQYPGPGPFPNPEGQYPPPGAPQPDPGPQYPGPGPQYPGPGTQQPDSGTQQPDSNQQPPNPGQQYPPPGTQQPPQS